MTEFKAIPTNVITGFLGVGKTTAILNLLKQKPNNERWAVLVNEFGEVGIDGSLFTGNESDSEDVFIREVPGGCMCCAAGLPMQIALNRLLIKAKPHRLLIEPTGLGHPEEVLATLRSEHYADVLDLLSTITLVDARKINDERYIKHPIFNQQLSVADIIVANKSDLYRSDDISALQHFLKNKDELNKIPLQVVSQGNLQLSWLEQPSSYTNNAHKHHHLHDDKNFSAQSFEIPSSGYLTINNEGEGFYSQGWIFTPQWIFDSQKLWVFLLGVNTERIKGVFITNEGIVAFNKADGVLTSTTLDECEDSRIEFISSNKQLLTTLEEKIMECVINNLDAN